MVKYRKIYLSEETAKKLFAEKLRMEKMAGYSVTYDNLIARLLER